MHPPFYTPHHPVHDHLHVPRGRPPRRSAPSPLVLRPVVDGWPPVPLSTKAPSLPPGGPVLRIAVVPPPQETWRDRIGRFLIRIGQRMILTQRPG